MNRWFQNRISFYWFLPPFRPQRLQLLEMSWPTWVVLINNLTTIVKPNYEWSSEFVDESKNNISFSRSQLENLQLSNSPHANYVYLHLPSAIELLSLFQCRCSLQIGRDFVFGCDQRQSRRSCHRTCRGNRRRCEFACGLVVDRLPSLTRKAAEASQGCHRGWQCLDWRVSASACWC